MSEYVILEDVADERGESPAKVARTLLRLGCDLYLHFGPSRKSRSGVSFYPEHPSEHMKHNIGPGDHPLTKDSQEVVIKRLGRGDFTTLGLLVWIYTKVDSSITVPYQIELMEKDESICVVVDPDDVAKLPPLRNIRPYLCQCTLPRPRKKILKFLKKKPLQVSENLTPFTLLQKVLSQRNSLSAIQFVPTWKYLANSCRSNISLELTIRIFQRKCKLVIQGIRFFRAGLMNVDNGKYEGEWKNGLFHGKGIRIFPGGEKYE